jgi:hypothetical protein
MIHIANGHSLTSLIERAGIPGERAVWGDVLHEGPVPDVGPEALLAIRAAYIADGLGEVSDLAVLTEMEQWARTLMDVAPTHDEVVLWYEHDLFDQLNLIHLLDAMRQHRPPRVTLVSINAYPGHPRFRGMGELTPPDIASLFTQRRTVVDDQFELAARAWAAFRSEDPRDIERLIATDTSPLPFLAAALRRHLEEFPGLGTGLSRTERNILALLEAGKGPTGLHDLIHLHWIDEHEDAFFIGDLSFGNVLKSLSKTTPALIALEVDRGEHRGFPDGKAWITPDGSHVLNGGADRVQLCGIDRWLGGVHLEGRGPTWRWEPGLESLTWA